MSTKSPVSDRPSRRFWHVPVAGFIGAVLLAAASLTPSLLPHAPAIQGVVTGLAAAFGYGLGVLVGLDLRVVARRGGPAPYGSRRTWAWLAPAGLGVLAVAWSWASRGRPSSAGRSGPSPHLRWWLVTAAVALLVCLLLVGLGRSVRRLARWGARHASARGIGRRTASALGVLVAGLVTVAVTAAVVALAFAALGVVFGSVNDSTTEGVSQPTSAPVSGSQRSVVGWDSLGTDGRDFVTGAPSRDRISTFTGEPAQDPVRAYVGLESAATPEQRARWRWMRWRRSAGSTDPWSSWRPRPVPGSSIRPPSSRWS